MFALFYLWRSSSTIAVLIINVRSCSILSLPRPDVLIAIVCISTIARAQFRNPFDRGCFAFVVNTYVLYPAIAIARRMVPIAPWPEGKSTTYRQNRGRCISIAWQIKEMEFLNLSSSILSNLFIRSVSVSAWFERFARTQNTARQTRWHRVLKLDGRCIASARQRVKWMRDQSVWTSRSETRMNRAAISAGKYLTWRRVTFTIAEVLQMHNGRDVGMANGIVHSSAIKANAKLSVTMLSKCGCPPTCVT